MRVISPTVGIVASGGCATMRKKLIMATTTKATVVQACARQHVVQELPEGCAGDEGAGAEDAPHAPGADGERGGQDLEEGQDHEEKHCPCDWGPGTPVSSSPNGLPRF